jgi:hypothetical protein
VFHTGHYNKMIEVLGRRIAVEYSFGSEESYDAVVKVAGAMIAMLEADSPEKFDLPGILEKVKEKTEEWVMILNDDNMKETEGFMEKFGENIHRLTRSQ